MRTYIASLMVMFAVAAVTIEPAKADFWKSFAQGMADELERQNNQKGYLQRQLSREREQEEYRDYRSESASCERRGMIWSDRRERCVFIRKGNIIND